MLKDDHWKVLASHANAMAKRLLDGVAGLEGCRIVAPTEINEVFAVIPKAMAEALTKAGAIFAPWDGGTAEPDVAPGEGETMIRLVASFATRPDDVDRFLDAAQGAKAA